MDALFDGDKTNYICYKYEKFVKRQPIRDINHLHIGNTFRKILEPSKLYIVRRCDQFYRYWHDVTGPLGLREANLALAVLTGGGRHSMTPDCVQYYDVFAVSPLPGWAGPPPLIRRLFPQDVAAIKNHYLGLNIDDRRLRFFREANDGQIAGYADGIDWKRSLLVGAVQHDRIIGMAEAGFDDHDPPRHAEVAVSVDAAVRGRGLGRCLARRAVEHAAARGAQATCFLFLRENRPVQRLVRSLGGRLDMEALSGIITLGGAGSGRVAFGKPVPV